MDIKLERTKLMPPPADLPKGYIAYNPSSVVIERDAEGHDHYVVFLRVEPDSEEHLGKTWAVAYEIDEFHLNSKPRPYHGIKLPGEDPAIKRIPVPAADGAIHWRWLVSTVTARPEPAAADGVAFETTFWLVDQLVELLDPDLKPFTKGPARMKDVRVVSFGSKADSPGTRLLIFGRPQITANHGTISAVVVDELAALNAGVIDDAPIIDKNLFSQDINAGPDVLKKGAANDAIWLIDELFLVLGHVAWHTGAPEYAGRHYEAALFEFDYASGSIRPVGTLATRDSFDKAKAKKDVLDLTDVVFPGGFTYDETGAAVPLSIQDERESHMVTFGLSDSQWGIGVVSCPRGLLSHGCPPAVRNR